MKVFIRQLNECLWDNEAQRERLRRYLNRLGFYVLTQDDGSLFVYAIRDDRPLDLRLYEVALKWIKEICH